MHPVQGWGDIPERWLYVPSVLMLYESGVHLVLQRTRKPAGKALRRWFADEVMPQLARDGRYAPERTVIDGEIKLRPEAEELRARGPDAWKQARDVEELLSQGPKHWKHLPAGRRAALQLEYERRYGDPPIATATAAAPRIPSKRIPSKRIPSKRIPSKAHAG
jgi:hypothetical protein